MTEEPPPWHAAYPAPRTTNPPSVSRAELRAWLKEGQTPGVNFVLVDLRRNDHEGGTIRGAINLPAQTLYPSIPTLYNVFSRAGIQEIIWYCGSSRGRGTRAAGWFNDYLEDHNDTIMKSYTLLEGIKGWVHGGKEYIEMMDEYQEGSWPQTA